MGYLPNYKYDIFLSYAHLDNVIYPNTTDGWITTFYRFFSQKIIQKLGKKDISIWWDEKKINGSDYFNDSIKDGIDSSAILVCFTSPGYLSSDYCRQERDSFVEKVKKESVGLKVGTKSRIINVFLAEFRPENLPADLQGSTGYDLFDENGDLYPTTEKLFAEQIAALSKGIAEVLTELIKTEIAPVSAPTKVKKNPKIFIGTVSDSLASTKKRLINDLKLKGYELLMVQEPAKLTFAEHEADARTKIKSSDVSIHLLDQYDGTKISGHPELSYVQQETRFSLEDGNATIVWSPDEIDIQNIDDDESYKLFIGTLPTFNSNRANLGNYVGIKKAIYDYIRGSKGNVLIQIAETIPGIIERRESEISQSTKKSERELMSTLLDVHSSDSLNALGLVKELFENNIPLTINSQNDDDPKSGLNALQGVLAMTNKLVFFGNAVKYIWIESRLDEALKFFAEKKLSDKEVYIYLVKSDTQDIVQIVNHIIDVGRQFDKKLVRRIEMVETPGELLTKFKRNYA